MKAFLIFTLSFFVAVATQAQSDTAFANKTASKPLQADNALGLIPKTNPLFFLGFFQNNVLEDISLEKEFLKHESFQLTYEYLYQKTGNPPNQTNGNLSVLNPEFRYYFNKRLSHSSFFAGAGMDYILNRGASDIYPFENKFGAGINGGGRLIYKRIVLDFCFGLNTNFPVFTPTAVNMGNTFFTVVYGIGYRF